MKRNWFAYVGTFSSPAGDALRCYRYDGETGGLSPEGVTHTFGNPSYVADRGKPVVYVTSDTDNFQGLHDGAVASFSVDRATGALTLLNMLPAGGAATCFLATDETGEHVYTANYMGGSVSCFATAENGELKARLFTLPHEGHSVNAQRQEAPHVHCLAFSKNWSWLLAADLGTDRVELYRHDRQTGMLEREAARGVKMPDGFGPRHIAFSPDGRYAYVTCEMGNTVVVLSFDEETGALSPVQQIGTLPEGWQGESTTAAIRVTPDGRFLYVSNRGHNSVACFAISPSDGTLTLLEIVPSGGNWPRDIVLDPTGRFLFVANAESNAVSRFELDARTGALLRPCAVAAEAPGCSCVHFIEV